MTGPRHLNPPQSLTEYDLSIAATWSEAQFQAWVIGYAVEHGWLVHHTHDSRSNARGVSRGLPDTILVRDGRLLFFELKVGKAKPDTAQLLWLHRIAAVAQTNPGVKSAVMRPSDLPRIKELLE